MDLATLIHRAKQLNPNNLLFWKSRGLTTRPLNWQDLVAPGHAVAKCAHGFKEAVCWLCSWTGLFCVGTGVAVGAISYHFYNKHKEEVHHHAKSAATGVVNTAGRLVNLARNVGYYCGISTSNSKQD